MPAVAVFDPETAALQDYPFGSEGTVKSWQPIGNHDADSLGAGVCEYRGVFRVELHYDAVYYLISGRLTVVDDQGEHTVSAGQIMFLPHGHKARYVSAEGCRLFWAIYPGDWEETTDFSINEPTGSPT